MSESHPPAPVALVTGARGGIGRAVDTTTPEGAAAAVAACRAQLGEPPALLAHCVGSTLIAPLHRSTPAQVREVLRVNLDSGLFTLQAWIEALRAAGRPGAAVLVSSVVARIGVANHEAIAAAKGGLEALVRSAAATYAGAGLRVNAVAPGMTDTPMTRAAGARVPRGWRAGPG
ncbi:SDR family oxidoreductase [Piscinibacter sakaiensis]|uniref:SDR family NAD(P)-dependent oxidoreductase n=1 Tax=Piscinibacter sakaiensis TaxID=1547922 RepID=UPI0037273924